MSKFNQQLSTIHQAIDMFGGVGEFLYTCIGVDAGELTGAIIADFEARDMIGGARKAPGDAIEIWFGEKPFYLKKGDKDNEN